MKKVLQNDVNCGNIKLGHHEKSVRPRLWLRGQAVKTSPFHGGNTGSIPVGVIDIVNNMPMWLNWQSS